MKWLLPILVALMLAWATSARGEEPIDMTHVFYECPTPELAEEAALIEPLTFGVTELPYSCYWVYGERQAAVLELIKPIFLSDGSIVWLGKVKRDLAPAAYSAGRISQELV